MTRCISPSRGILPTSGRLRHGVPLARSLRVASASAWPLRANAVGDTVVITAQTDRHCPARLQSVWPVPAPQCRLGLPSHERRARLCAHNGAL
jgi:hypothetical protein